MKKYFVVTIFIFSIFYQAQTHRFIYEFSYVQDTLKGKAEKSDMVLDIAGNDVQFYEFQALRIDSTNRSNGNATYTHTFPFNKLKRKVASGSNKEYQLISEDYFYFESEDKIDWKISADTKEVKEMKLQKATAKFGGRFWEAWFTTSIPFSEGPYKFNGLPGLIVELKDSKNHFNYTLVKIEKPLQANVDIVETLFKKVPLKISSDKYNDLLIASYNDPYSRFRTMRPGTWSVSRNNGEPVETVDGLNQMTRDEQADIRKDYNPIELNKAVLYKK